VSLEESLEAASTVPARAIGAGDVGRIEVGLPADVVVLTDDLTVDRVLVAGDEFVAA
jgi:N-acetylglucosamine-6-phosphate deacetylase